MVRNLYRLCAFLSVSFPVKYNIYRKLVLLKKTKELDKGCVVKKKIPVQILSQFMDMLAHAHDEMNPVCACLPNFNKL